MSSHPDAIAATVHLLGVTVSREDREEISATIEPDLRARWSVPKASVVAGLTEQNDGFHSAVAVHLPGVAIDSVAKPRLEAGEREAGSDLWRGLDHLVSGIWRKQVAAEGCVKSDSYVVFDLANDLAAIKLSPPDQSSGDEGSSAPIEAALNARFASLSLQWETLRGEFGEQTRGPVARVYVLSERGSKWTLARPTESECFLLALRPGALLANPHEGGAEPSSERAGSS